MATSTPASNSPDDLLYQTALHEAGHAVAAHVLGHTLRAVTIIPATRCSHPLLGEATRLGACHTLPRSLHPMLDALIATMQPDQEGLGDLFLRSFALLKATHPEEAGAVALRIADVSDESAIIRLAGAAAAGINSGCAPDVDNAFELVRAALSWRDADNDDTACLQHISTLYEYCLTITEVHREAIESLAAALLEQLELTGDQVHQMIAAAIQKQTKK